MTNHQVDHHDLDDRFTGLRQQLILLAQPPVATDPSRPALRDPAFGRQVEVLGTVGTLDDYQMDFAPAPPLPSGWQVMGHQTPRTADAHDIKGAIKDRQFGVSLGSAAGFGSRHQMLNHVPF